ncbi:MAG: hypothetical protein Q8914_11045 [Bacteroidota bacterium]|nr:hypothetical protein [Bacteroidota bacterium]
MKKNLVGLLAVVLIAAGFVSCNKDDDNNQKESTLKVRIATFADDWDTWTYSYNTEGQLIKVYRDETKQWNFRYNGDSIIISGTDNYKILLGKNGYVASMADDWDARTYTYDALGHLTQVKKNGTVVSNLKIDAGCITTWSKWMMKGTDTQNVEHFKNQTFSTVKNVAKIHNIYSEMFGGSRWLMETGIFGIPSDYLCEQTVWDYSTSPAALTYEFDTNNCVTHEIKTGADYVENYYYTWTVVK